MRRPEALGVVLAVVLVLMSGCGGDDSSVVVPYVVGLREPLATQVVERAGLVPEIRRAPDADIRRGFVYFQSPREGSTADENDMLRISVSTGPPS